MDCKEKLDAYRFRRRAGARVRPMGNVSIASDLSETRIQEWNLLAVGMRLGLTAENTPGRFDTTDQTALLTRRTAKSLPPLMVKRSICGTPLACLFFFEGTPCGDFDPTVAIIGIGGTAE